MNNTLWHDKPYYSLDAYLKNTKHHKCYKIALDAGMTCPNRDGKIDTRGCIFCSAGGSGDFAVSGQSISEQIEKGLATFGDKKVGNDFIAYFQAYTNTYAPVSRLETLYTEALEHPLVCGISIATRPDCLSEEILSLLDRLKNEYPDKFIWVELGLQTIHEATASYIRRGYPLAIFESAVNSLSHIDVPCVTHVILGLPGENKEDMLATISYLNTLPVWGIKLQLLHVLRGTDLAIDYENKVFRTLEKSEYLDVLISCIEHLRPDMVLHRVTGDGPKDLTIAPLWSMNKRDVLNSLHKQMKAQNSYQGRLFHVT